MEAFEVHCDCGTLIAYQGEHIGFQMCISPRCGGITDPDKIEVMIRMARVNVMKFDIGSEPEGVTVATDECGYISFMIDDNVSKKLLPGDYFMSFRITQNGMSIETNIQKVFTLLPSKMEPEITE